MENIVFQSPLSDVVEKYDVLAVFVFGSQVKGTTHGESDIDVGIFVENRRTHDVLPLYDDLREIAKFPEKLDIVIVDEKNSAPFLMFEITKGELLFEREPGYGVLLKARAMHRYWDDQHRLSIKHSYLLKEYAS